MERSLWLREAMAAGFEPAPRLEGGARADVCIVGGGYTGLWTALQLKEASPSLDVAIVEADICGGGASGRNGGFVLSWWSKFLTLEKMCGTEEALRLARASAEGVCGIGEFCEANEIDAAYHRRGWIWAATNEAQLGAWRSTMEGLDRAGAHPFEELTAEQTAERTGSPVHLGAVFETAGAVVQPAKLAFGLRRLAMSKGVRIFERSPMTVLDGTRVRTAAGRVDADRVVLALNAWAVRFAELRRRLVIVGSDIVATAPAPERLADIGWAEGASISDSRLLVHYYRTTDDGRIAFGKGGGAVAFGRSVGRWFEGPSRRAASAEAAFRRTYPMLGDVPVETSWTGPIDRSRNGLPFFGFLGGRREVAYGVGYSGNGVGPAFLAGKILASLALDRDDEWSRCALVGGRVAGLPPEPFRFVGGHMVRAAIARKERLEDEGRTAGPLTNRLVALAPAGLVPTRGR